MVVACKTDALSGKEFGFLELALWEALADAVIHGCGNDASKVVECSVSGSESGEVYTIVVRDPGPGFDPASIPSPVVRAKKIVLKSWARHVFPDQAIDGRSVVRARGR